MTRDIQPVDKQEYLLLYEIVDAAELYLEVGTNPHRNQLDNKIIEFRALQEAIQREQAS